MTPLVANKSITLVLAMKVGRAMCKRCRQALLLFLSVKYKVRWVRDKCLQHCSLPRERKRLNRGGWPLRQRGWTRANRISPGWNINRRMRVANWGSGLYWPPRQDTFSEVQPCYRSWFHRRILLCAFNHGRGEPSLWSNLLCAGVGGDWWPLHKMEKKKEMHLKSRKQENHMHLLRRWRWKLYLALSPASLPEPPPL